MGLIDKLTNEEFAAAALKAAKGIQTGAPQPEGDRAPTDGEILSAYESGLPPEIRALGKRIVERIVATEPRSTEQIGRDAIGVAKKIHHGVNAAIDFFGSGGGKATPKVPTKSDSGVRVAQGAPPPSKGSR